MVQGPDSRSQYHEAVRHILCSKECNLGWPRSSAFDELPTGHYPWFGLVETRLLVVRKTDATIYKEAFGVTKST